MKDRHISAMLLEQTNDVLDALEGKKTIVQVTSFIGAQFVDIQSVQERMRRLKFKDALSIPTKAKEEPKEDVKPSKESNAKKKKGKK